MRIKVMVNVSLSTKLILHLTTDHNRKTPVMLPSYHHRDTA
jgi:hypothetical protein